MINRTILGYTILSRLGEGGMAEVYYAENSIGKKAAVKFLKKKFCDDDGIVERFRNEAKVMVALDHPNIRQVFDYAELDGQPAIIMEYLEGDDLKSLIKGGRRFTGAEVTRLWDSLCDALNCTHAKGIVHRDIKPSNIFITNKGVVKLLDFGIAKVKDAVSGTQTGQKMGTLLYMSPEQIKDTKRVDYRTDVYSLAVTFVHLFRGAVPYDETKSSEWEIMNKIVSEPLDMSGVPESWKTFLTPYLAKDPGDRPALREFTPVPAGSHEPPVEPEVTVVDDPKPQPGPAPEPKQEETVMERKGDGNRFTVNGVSFEMVDVEGGTFWIGAHCKMTGLFKKSIPNYDSNALGDESPVHEVTLSSYKIGKFEVTQELWEAVMGSNPSYFKGSKLPVENVSWYDAVEFCNRLSEETGRSPYYSIDRSIKDQTNESRYDDLKWTVRVNRSANGFRLPTEAEWEYAARGGNWSKGYKYSGGNSIGDVAWYTYNSGQKTHAVGTKSPNELGIYDMIGNVLEWCHDWYGDYVGGSQTDPQGLSSGSFRVLRGGGWYCYAKNCRVSSRYYGTPDHRRSDLGFRLVLVP